MNKNNKAFDFDADYFYNDEQQQDMEMCNRKLDAHADEGYHSGKADHYSYNCDHLCMKQYAGRIDSKATQHSREIQMTPLDRVMEELEAIAEDEFFNQELAELDFSDDSTHSAHYDIHLRLRQLEDVLEDNSASIVSLQQEIDEIKMIRQEIEV